MMKSTMIHRFSFVLALLFGSLFLPAQSVQELDRFIAEVGRDFEIPSLSVAVVKDGEVILQKSYSSEEPASGFTPDEQSLYAIASLSKAFTTAAMGILVDEGALDWEDRVQEHLPWFALHDEYVGEHFTIEDLLCHRSGFITFDGDLLWYGSDYTREEIVKRIRQRPLTYGFRQKFGYQNIMYITAGEVIEAVSGQNWEDFVEERLLQPLGMSRTTALFTEFSQDENKALPTLEGEVIPMLSYDNSGATAALNSCTADMARWLQFWLGGGVFQGDTLLSAASFAKITGLYTPLPLNTLDRNIGTHFKGYGLGWFLMDYRGQKVLHHGGGLPGYISKAAVVPEAGLGVIVLTNAMTPAPNMLMYALIDWNEGENYQVWKQRYLPYYENVQKQKKQETRQRLEARDTSAPRLAAEAYTGRYMDAMYGNAEVRLKDGKLSLHLLPAEELFSGPMQVFGEHSFMFEFADPFLPFGVARFEVEEGQVTGFGIELPNDDFHFDKLVFKRVE